MSIFLSIPLELRLIIYAQLLEDHRTVLHNHQPSNAHIAFLHTCKQIDHEAGQLAGFRNYLSLRYEREIAAFLNIADEHVASRISRVDVATDGRLVQHPKSDVICTPVSRLHRVLDRLPSLTSMRVFDCHRVRSIHEFVSGARFFWAFEKSMFPNGKRHGISSYEYFIAPSTKTVGLECVSAGQLRRLRLAGLLRLHEPLRVCQRLEHLTIHGVTGNYFDRNPLMGMESLSLATFQYCLGHQLGYEIRDEFLSSLLAGSAVTLRKLVLLQCSKLSTAALTNCIKNLRSLEYFAVSLITVRELETDFIAAFPSSLRVLKLKITAAKFAAPLIKEEGLLCASLELMFTRRLSVHSVYLHLPHVISQSDMKGKWASYNHVLLHFGDWESEEVI